MSVDTPRYGAYKEGQEVEREMTEPMDNNRIINRHKARLLDNLEQAGCPVVFKDAVISALNWLRSDINENDRNGENNENNERSGNH